MESKNKLFEKKSKIFNSRVNVQVIQYASIQKCLDLSHSSFSNFFVYVLPLLMYTAYNFIRNKYLVIQNTTRCFLFNPQGRGGSLTFRVILFVEARKQMKSTRSFAYSHKVNFSVN